MRKLIKGFLSVLLAIVICGSSVLFVLANPESPAVETWTEQGGTSATLTLAKPANVAVGDLLVLICMNDSESASPEFSDNLDGWNFVNTAGDAVSDAHIGVFWRIANGTEGDTIEVTAETLRHWTGFYVRISGADGTTPINTSAFDDSFTISDTYAIGEVTTDEDNCLVLYGLSFDGGDGFPFSVAGEGWAEIEECQSDTGGTASSGCFGSRDLASQGASGAATVTCSIADGAAWFQMAIAPPTANPPTVTTQAASDILATTATGNGNITAVNNGTCDLRGFVWDLATHGDPSNVAPAISGYANDVPESNGFGTGPFTGSLTGLPTGDTIYVRAYAHNENGYGYGDEVNFLTKPAGIDDLTATDGTHSGKVVLDWTLPTGATGVRIYEGINLLDTLGAVETYDDNAAPKGTVSGGTGDATDGTVIAHSVLTVAGHSVTNGASRTYKAIAFNATGDADDSNTDTGYTTPGAFSYQWQISDADLDAAFNPIGGATTNPYNATEFPANGDGRWVYCEVSAVDATNNPQDSTHDRGYRGVLPTVTVQAVGDISYYTATGNGDITSIGSDNCDKRGFVWDEGTHGDPGNVAPGASGYANNGADTGDYGIGPYTYGLTGLSDNQIYYVRAYVHNPAGYDYSDTEVNFTTLEATVPTVLTKNASLQGIGGTLNGEITGLAAAPEADQIGFVWGWTSLGDPGNTAPEDTAYDWNWSETGSFGLEEFSHLAELDGVAIRYYFRACAHSIDGWAYGEELDSITGAEDRIYLEIRPQFDEGIIRGPVGGPTQTYIGLYQVYIMPIWSDPANVIEELYFRLCVPDRWDGDSYIYVHLNTVVGDADEFGKSYRWELAWEHCSPNEDIIPVVAPNTDDTERVITSHLPFFSYGDWFIIMHNVGDGIKPDDQLVLRLRRIATEEPQAVEVVEDPMVHHLGMHFARGDLLGDPEGGVTTIINNLIIGGILIGGADMLLLAFIVFALGLTIAAFALKQQILAFAAAGGWLFLGIYALSLSTAPLDLYWSIMFFCMFMTVVMSFAGVGIRRRDKSAEEHLETEEPSDLEDYANQQEEAMNPVRQMRRTLGGRKKKTKLSRAEKHYLMTGEEKPLTGDLKRRVNAKGKRR